MKTKLVSLIFAFAVCSISAQEICESLTQLKEGAHVEYTDYGKKGKPQSKSSHTTTGISTDGDKVTATVKVDVQDLKNKNNVYSNEYGISCENGVISVDMMRFFDAERLSAMGGNMEVQVDGNAINFPSNASAGDVLEDGHITVSMESGGVAVMTMTMNIYNRNVVGEESLSTPAGTFDCIKMTYDFDSNMGIIKVRGSAEQWYTKDQMMVQSITKNKKGKEIGKSVLTKLEL